MPIKSCDAMSITLRFIVMHPLTDMLEDEIIDSWMEREALHFAASEGDLSKVKELIDQGHDLNAFDDLSWTPLHHAVREEKYNVVKYLILAGADVNAHEEERIGETPLGEVAGNCKFKMAKLLIEAGADPTIPGWMQVTALHRASERKKDEGRKVYELLQSASKRFKTKCIQDDGINSVTLRSTP